MRSIIAWMLVATFLAVCNAQAESTRFADGTLDVFWADVTCLVVAVRLGVPPPQTSDASLTWVLTVNALRFPDSIHSWQLHLSSVYQSAVVIPNDFLLTRRLTLEQLGIEISAWEPGVAWALHIPRSGAVPELVAPGDVVEIHALWLQQSPLVSACVPEFGIAGEDAGTGGEAADKEASSPYLPSRTAYAVGEAVSHAFQFAREDTGLSLDRMSARIALVRIGAEAGDELVGYLYCEPDPATGRVAYEFDTAGLTPGAYDLIVWVDPPGAAVRSRFELVALVQ